MTINTTHGILDTALKALALAINKRTALPILGTVRVTTDGNGDAHLETFDYETSVNVRLPGQATLDATDTAIMYGDLVTAAKTFTVGSTARKVRDTKITLDGSVLTGQGYTFTCETKNVEDYPSLPVIPDGATEFSCNIVTLQTEINRVSVAAGGDIALPMLTGINFEFTEQGIELAATDRFRLHTGWVATQTTTKQDQKNILVPADSLKRVLKMLGTQGQSEINLRVEDGMLWLTCGYITVSLRLLDSEFVKYKTLIPVDGSEHIIFDRAEIMGAVKKVAVFQPKASGVVVKVDDGKLTVSTTGGDRAATSPAIPVTTVENGTFEFLVNPEYLGETLATFLTASVAMRFQSAAKPMLFAEDKTSLNDSTAYRSLVMPTRRG